MQDPLEWLSHLSDAGLKKWLRDAVWRKELLPLSVPPSSSLVVYLSDLFNIHDNQRATDLRLRLREILPILLQEWGRFDPPQCLTDLLYLCGTLRCSAAEPIILSIARERVDGLKEEVSLRQTCLSVLSGLGPSEATYNLFKYYIRDPRYTALCYRALYRLRLSYGAAELPTVFAVYNEAGLQKRLKTVVKRLFFEYLKPDQHADVIRIFLEEAHSESFEGVLKFLSTIEVINLPLWQKMTPNHRVETLKLIFEKAPPNSIQRIFNIFERADALARPYFSTVGLRQKFEMINTFLRRGHPDSFRPIINVLMRIDIFSLSLFLQLNSTERLEIMTLLLNGMNPQEFAEIYKLLNGMGIDLGLITAENIATEHVSIRYKESGFKQFDIEDHIPIANLRDDITDHIFYTSQADSGSQLDAFLRGQEWNIPGKAERPN